MTTTTIRLIGLLRAKAASTTFPAERDALLAKAAELEAGGLTHDGGIRPWLDLDAWRVLPDGYYAVADPDHGDLMTYWRRASPLPPPPRPGPGEPCCAAHGDRRSRRYTKVSWSCPRPAGPDGFCPIHARQAADGKPLVPVRERRGRHAFDPWPDQAEYGPTTRFHRRDIPKHPEQRRVFWDAVRARSDDWHLRLVAVLVADPLSARARFAVFTTRCCHCGTELSDPYSKTVGIGPVCRDGMSDEFLAGLALRVGKAHGHKARWAVAAVPSQAGQAR